jgi:hypothetical protein
VNQSASSFIRGFKKRVWSIKQEVKSVLATIKKQHCGNSMFLAITVTGRIYVEI